MSLTTSKTIYRSGFGPLMPGVFVAPFPYSHHCPNLSPQECCNSAIADLELLLKQQTSPSETAALLIEPILGEGGYVPPPKDFLKILREICNKNNILMICDEVQTGFGRTGKFFAVEHFNVVPDILVFAKGIASGFPLSGIASTDKLMQTQPPGSMGGTYSGNAVSCAAACATIDLMKKENILANVNERGSELRDGLLKLQKKYPLISDVRGLGLMIGVEFDKKKAPHGFANNLSKSLVNHGMLLLTTSCFETVRFIPPLNVSKDEIAKGLQIFDHTLEHLIK